MKLTIVLFWCLLFGSQAIAQDADRTPAEPTAEPPEIPEPPPLPPKAVPPDDMAIPTVTIRQEEGQIVEEYRINGVLSMIKVTPEKGPAYYLVDTTGDGDLETKWYENEGGVKPVYYKIFEWQ